MKNDAVKATKLGDYFSVSRMEQHEKKMVERATVKKNTETASKSSKVPRVC